MNEVDECLYGYDFLRLLVRMNEVDDFVNMFQVAMISCECW